MPVKIIYGFNATNIEAVACHYTNGKKPVIDKIYSVTTDFYVGLIRWGQKCRNQWIKDN